VVWHACFTQNYTGWSFLNKVSINLEWWFTNVYKAGPHSADYVRYCQSSASQISYPPLIERTTYSSRFNHWVFSIANPTAWNLLPIHVRDPSISCQSALNTFLFIMPGTRCAIEAFFAIQMNNRRYDYHLWRSESQWMQCSKKNCDKIYGIVALHGHNFFHFFHF